ncbi:MAG: hypothetical protein KY475_01920, partial [Planctomycetes bacterium]|nr:hypothetical protein [Planctomycetota bacterium]
LALRAALLRAALGEGDDEMAVDDSWFLGLTDIDGGPGEDLLEILSADQWRLGRLKLRSIELQQ